MRRLPAILVIVAVALSWLADAGLAQQQKRGGSPADTVPPGWLTIPTPQIDLPAAQPAPNTTVVPRSPVEPKASATPPAGAGAATPGQVSLVALLTDDGQGIEQGLLWRVFRPKGGPDGKARLLVTSREPNPSLRLEPGEYLINVAFGRAHLTRSITVSGERNSQERFVLNAGGLRLSAVLANREAIPERLVAYDIYSDERDQHGQRIRIMSGAKPGVIVRLNAGVYGIVSTYGDVNAMARADVAVEAGKLTETILKHPAARVTFKLVTRTGGDAIAETQWSLANAQGEQVKESFGALPAHILAPGTYSVSARHAGQVFKRSFTVRAGDTAQVEVVMQ